MATVKKPASLESQLYAMENVLKQAVLMGKPQKNIFAINGKINQIKKQIEQKNWDEYLAK